MATYKFGKYTTWDCRDFFAIQKKNIFGCWTIQKSWDLGMSILGDEYYSGEYEKQQR